MSGCEGKMKLYGCCRRCRSWFAREFVALVGALFVLGSMSSGYATAGAQEAGPAPVVVQPGAPGMPSRRLPDSTRPVVPAVSQADVAFMQGMIMHHSQAVEMTAMIESHTKKKDVRLLAARSRMK